ncbi:tape measure protein [Pseudotamlana carrageenivorans]|uniref:Phage tail tape measure protein n=1 Tax=Pseudotamlana carrageenivorans TaxID=2069432 RepID=A0A2I7SF24_9FLAO|nr:tape measure protein [Tamlana carrageenivorans]AUS04484.1 phage tail tape measure protein [Tamlana carrageenivorans]
MANLLEYTLSLNDQMSAKLQKIGVNSGTALDIFAKLETQTKEVDRVMKGTGTSVGALRRKLDLLKSERDWIPQSNIQGIRKYNTEIKRLTSQINRFETINGSRTKSWFQDAFSQIPMSGLLTNPLVMGGLAVGKSLRVGIEQEMQQTSFEVLLGGEDAAKDMMQEISEYAKKTPYKKLGLGDATKTMLGFGIAQEKIMPTLKALGDVAMGDANKMNSLTLAYSQMSSTGKLTGQDLLQMINAGFNPLNEISKQTGKSIGELKDDMAKGAISAEMVENAFISATSEGGQFNGMADKMSKTIGGRFSTLMDSLEEKFLALFGAIQPVASVLLDMAIYGLDAVGSGMAYLIDQFQAGNPIIVMATGLILSMATALAIMKVATMAQSAWTWALATANKVQTASWWQLNAAMLANPVTWIIAGVVALIGLIGYLVYKVDGWGEAWSNTVNGVKSLWGAYMSYLKLTWLGGEHIILSGIDAIKVAWLKLKGLWDEEGAQAGLSQIQRQSNERLKAIEKTQDLLKQQGKDAVGSFVAGWNSLSVNDKSIGDVKDSISNKLGIGAPKVPGTNGSVVTNLDTNKTNNNKQTNTATATGGTKHNYVTISLQSLIENLRIEGKNFKDSAKQMEDQTVEALVRTLAMASTAVG